MNINDVLAQADGMKTNMMPRQMKVAFIEELDQKIYHELVLTHFHSPFIKMPQYDRESDEGTELLLPERFKMVYVYWIMTRIDQYNQETEKENNNRARFENEYEQMSDWWTRTHRPIPARPFFRI